jgi:hypothetical protein
MQLLVRDMDDLMFGANEMSICKQDLILQEELNCETSISVREAASQQSLSGYIKIHLLSHDPELWHRLLHSTPFFLHLHLLLENFDLHEHLRNQNTTIIR